MNVCPLVSVESRLILVDADGFSEFSSVAERFSCQNFGRGDVKAVSSGVSVFLYG